MSVQRKKPSGQQVFLLQAELTRQMGQRCWAEAIETADHIVESGTRDKRIWEAVLAAYIDGGDGARGMQASLRYEQLFGLDGIGRFLRGRAEHLNGNWREAEQSFLQALQDKAIPDWYRGAAYSILATLYRETGQAEQAAAYYLKSAGYKSLENGRAAEYSNYLFNLHYLKKSPEFMLLAAKAYGDMVSVIPRYEHERKRRHEKLRIGYVSPDLHFHVVAFFSYAFLKNYDAQCFEVYCYTDCVEDSASREFRTMVDVWRNVRGLKAPEAASLIRRDEIDILVDLAGHTADNFLLTLAYRPAPVQVSGIGYFATTGLPDMDYFLADPYTDPEGNDAFFTEKLLRLPGSHFCYMWHDRPGGMTPAPFLRTGHITFGSLNNFSKVTDEMLRLWAEILRRTEGSQLYLQAKIFNNPYGKELALRRIRSAGIAEERLILRPFCVPYLNVYEQIDIALDTYPYPGGGTTCDALYMGVPVITLAGQRHNARFGYSLLMNIGLAECCAASPDEYVEKAVSLAADTRRLRELHQTLRRQMRQSPVMQSEDYMAAIELLWQKIWRNWYEADKGQKEQRELRTKAWQQLQTAMQAEDWGSAVRAAGTLAADENCPAKVWSAAGLAYAEMKQWGRASWWLRRAIKLDKENDAELYRLLAEAERSRHCYAAGYEAACAAEQCLLGSETVSPAFRMDILVQKAHSALLTGRPQEAAADYHRAFQLAQEEKDRCSLYSSWLMSMHNNLQLERVFYQAHLDYAKLFSAVQPYVHGAQSMQRGHRRMRIGYLSPDFRRHVMFYFYYQLLAAHDASRFELYGYSLGQTKDGFTDQAAACMDVWREVGTLSYAEIARQIHDDEIDILVDLAGHSANSGLPVLAWRPAPVQISGLGYMATTGLPAVDYFLTDAFTDPPGQAESYLLEKPLYLTSQFCYTGRSDVPVPEGAPCQKTGRLTFGVFNQYHKITDEMLRLWRDMLKKLPGSRLLLKNRSFQDDRTADLAYERMRSLGFSMDDVLLEGASDDYMERYLAVDIALDTYPYNGGGTTCDALYMGVPVVSLYGERRGSRFGLTILQSAGLGELAAGSPQEYMARALALAGDHELLDVLHKNLRTMLLNSALMDTQRYIGELETAYKKIWQDAVDKSI